MSQTLARPDWMTPAPDGDARYAHDFRCAVAGRALIGVSGADAAGFLHAQLSTDVRGMRDGDVALTSYSDARGRLLAVMRIIAAADRFLLELPADRCDAVSAQLRRYVLRADVTLEELSDSHTAFAAVGEEAAQCVTDVIPGLPPVTGESALLEGDARLIPARGPRAAWIVIGPVESARRAWQAFDALPVAPPAWWDSIEIEAGIPAIHEATAARFVAQMVNLDRLDALDFRKGCYPGQEVIARTHYLGRVKRRMYPLRGAESAPLPAPGDPVFAESGDSPCGEIVRAAQHPHGGPLMLAVLRTDAADGPLALGDGSPVSRLELPYPLEEAA